MLKSIVLFDGECSFCHRGVQFIIKRDPRKHFQFAPLKSEIGRELCSLYQVPEGLNSLILIQHGRYYKKSTAVLRICRGLKGMWKIFYVLAMIPPSFRDFVYDWVAKHRFLFGKNVACQLPKKEDVERFLK